MAERKQRVVGIFAIEGVVLPIAVEPAPIGPECVDEVEAQLLEFVERDLQARQSMQRRRSRKQIRYRCGRRCKEAASRMAAREQPRCESGPGGLSQMSQEHDCASRGRRQPESLLTLICETAVCSLHSAKARHHAGRIGHLQPQVLICAECKEAAVDTSLLCVRICVIASLPGAVAFESIANLLFRRILPQVAR